MDILSILLLVLILLWVIVSVVYLLRHRGNGCCGGNACFGSCANCGHPCNPSAVSGGPPMTRFQSFQDDLLYYSSAWEYLLSIPAVLAVLCADLHTYENKRLTLLIYGALLLLLIFCCGFSARKGRRYRLSHPECTREMKRRELEDRLFYDQAKKYFIGSGIVLVLLLWALLDGIFTQQWMTSGSILLAATSFLNLLTKGILSVRYERRQHLEFLRAHPEYPEKK